MKKEFIKECDEGYIKAVLRIERNYFSITGEINKNKNFTERGFISGGCVHEDIEKNFPELKHLIKWHLFDVDTGPMHYVSNALYFVSDRDCWGLLKDEKKQIIARKTGLPAWHLMAVDKITGEEKNVYEIDKNVDSLEQPECNYTLEFRPWCRIGEGKEIELEKARSAAIWPEATLEDFTKENLLARLPRLKEEFKKDMNAIGFEV